MKDISKFFIEENKIKDTIHEILSPSGKYKLIITQFKTKEGCWEYTQGLVYSTEDNKLISEIQRNYSRFPFAFVENHPNGNDYLLCGEDYQGQTIVELNTGIKKSRVSNSAIMGTGFCWVTIVPSPDKTMLAVEGCHWACPYEVNIFDFSDPMDMNWFLLYHNGNYDTFIKWNEDNSAEIGIEYDARKSDLKPEQFLTDEDYAEIDELEKILPYGEIWISIREAKIKWKRPAMLTTVTEHMTNFIDWRMKDDMPMSFDLVETLIFGISKLSKDDQELLFTNEHFFKKLQWAMNNFIFYKDQK